MKILFTILMLFLSLCTFAQEGWNDVTPAGTQLGFFGLDVVDSENIWVVGEGGIILNTTDGGTTWSKINCPVTYNLTDVDFINADTGLVGGHGDTDTEILRTTNGGTSWELIKLDNTNYSINDIEYIKGSLGDTSRAFITAGRSLVWKTDDVCENWGGTSIDAGCGAADIQSICFLNKDEGWFVGTAAQTSEVTIIHTTDGGVTYEIQDNPTDPDIKLNGVSFADNQHGIAAGSGTTILYTGDGGKNWETQSVSYYFWSSVHMNPSGKAWTVGGNGNILYSTDWGNSWTTQKSGVTCVLWEVIFIDDNEGWIVGGGVGQPGVILHTKSGGLITDIYEKQYTPTEYSLSQNFPNPFNPRTKIKYSIAEPGKVSMILCNVLGQEVKRLVNAEMLPGNYELEFNAEHIPSGIYFYQLNAGDFIQTKKMILMK
jgi:photosystem II stability/assembly factor-like uncharacterized protein